MSLPVQARERRVEIPRSNQQRPKKGCRCGQPFLCATQICIEIRCPRLQTMPLSIPTLRNRSRSVFCIAVCQSNPLPTRPFISLRLPKGLHLQVESRRADANLVQGADEEVARGASRTATLEPLFPDEYEASDQQGKLLTIPMVHRQPATLGDTKGQAPLEDSLHPLVSPASPHPARSDHLTTRI